MRLLALLVAAVAVAAFFVGRKEYPVVPPGSAIIMTGSSTGIGYESAVDLAKRGFVVYAGVRKEKDLEAIKALGVPTLVPVILDVTNQETIDSSHDFIVDDMKQRGISLGGLVNNAGIYESTPMEFTSMDKVNSVFDVNVYGVIRVTQRFLPLLRQSKGRIINISSMAGFLVLPRAAIYCGSKHALEAVSDALRMELAPFEVSVSVVQPGAVTTPIFDKAIESTYALDPKIWEVYSHLKPNEAKTEAMLGKAYTTECTNKAIHEALTSPYPSTRYPVAGLGGIPAAVWKVMVYILPARVLDHMMVSSL